MTREWEDDERAPFVHLPWDRPTSYERSDVRAGGDDEREREREDGTEVHEGKEDDDDAEDYTFHIPDEVRRTLGWCFWTPFE